MSFLIASGHVEVEAKTDKALSAITGLVGALGAVGPVAGVAAAGLASAGAGVAAFGVAAGKQIVDLKKASEAQGKYQEAVAQSGKGSKEAAKAQLDYQRVLATMPKATREAAAAWSTLTDEYKEWSDSLASDTMTVFTHSFQLFQAMLPKTTGLVKGTSAELDRFLTLIAGEVASPGFDRMMDDFTEFSRGSLRFVLDGILDLSRAVAGFAREGGFDDFVTTAKEAGPLLGETLSNLVELALNLTGAGGELGITMLTVANALAEMANAIPPEALSTMLQMYAALKLVAVGVAAVNTVASSAAVARLGAYFAVMRAAGVGPTLRATAASMTTMQKVAGGLGILGAVALGINELAEEARGAPPDVDRLTSSLKTLAASGKWSGELKATFEDMDGFVAKVNQIKQGTKELDIAKPFLDLAPGGAIVEKVAGKVDDLINGTKSFGAVKDDVKSFDQAFAAMVSSGHAGVAASEFKKFEAALKGAGYSTKEINQLFPEYKSAVAGLKAEQELAARGMGIFGQQAQEAGRKLDAQKAAADGLRASILALNDAHRSAYDAQITFEQAIDDLTASFKENGVTLDLNTEAGRKNGQAMSAAAKAHDEMLSAGLAAGESLGSMTAKSDQLRAEMMRLATATLGSKKKAEEYVNTLLGAPGEIKTMVKLERQEAITGLQAVQAEIQRTPGAKSITVDTLNAAAIKALEAVGLKTKQLPDGRTEVFTKNGQSLGNIEAVRRALNALDGKTANTYTTNHILTIRETRAVYNTVGRPTKGEGGVSKYARGGRVRGYASGGEVQMFPDGGYVDGPGSSTSDSILALMGSGMPARVSATEYVMRAAAVAKYGVRFMDAVNSGQLRLPGFAKGGKLTEKQKAQLQRQKEARGFLRGQSTLTDMSVIAGVRNAEISSTLGKERSEAALVDFLNQLQTQVSKAGFSKKTNAALQSQITSSAKKLFSLNDKYDKVTASLEKAKGSLDDLKGKFDQLKTSVASSLIGFGNITKIGKYGTSADTILKQLRSDTTRTTEFAKQLEQLKAKGLNATAISDIAAAGVTGGGMATAQSLLNATPEQIAEINRLQKQLEASANKAGTVTADAMYGAGIRAAEGLVKGLTAQQKAIETAMMSIAKAMEKSIKRALGIKSPSKVMEPIGGFMFQGMEQGWVKRAAVGNTLLGGNTAGLRVRPALLTGASSAAAPAAAPVVNLTATFNTMTLPSAAERKAFVRGLVKDFNDELLAYQKSRRR